MSSLVKVEIQQSGDITALAFEAKDEGGLSIVDAVRATIFGDDPKEGGYVSSRRFVVHVKNLGKSALSTNSSDVVQD